MIRLKNIRKENDKIMCDAFIEDSPNSVKLVLDISSGEMNDYILPEGYEWCHKHIIHARNALISMIRNNNIAPEKLVMWY